MRIVDVKDLPLNMQKQVLKKLAEEEKKAEEKAIKKLGDEIREAKEKYRKQIKEDHSEPTEEKVSKYHSKKVTLPMPDGTEHQFDSRHEAKVYEDLYLRECAGEISDLRIQVPFLLIGKQPLSNGKYERPVYYVADFVYTENGKQKVVDAKGYKKSTAYSVFVIKRKLMKYIHDIEVQEV